MIRYAFAIFLSAFLLFQVQPLIGRYVLPWFGGGPSIWTTCMLFFQLVLLGGYVYSHLLSTWLSIRSQVITHLAVLGLSLFFLPIIPSDEWKPHPDQSPSWQILWLLMATVGGPYFVLSTTGPLLQRWFSRTSPTASPYRLYALSNVGSLLALLTYPFVFEPWMRLNHQAFAWAAAYLIFASLLTWCAVRLWQQLGNESQPILDAVNSTEAGVDDVAGRLPSWWQMGLWLGLSASGSVMLLATTNQLCIDVATVPFLWILPLSIYLVTFILCFDNPRWYDRRVIGLLLLVTAPAACWALKKEADVAILDQTVIYSLVLFACCMACHGELVRSRPHPKYLTLFFVLVSAGGAGGGLFVAMIAPSFFFGYWEYHVGLAASVLMTLLAWYSQKVWQGKLVPEFWLWIMAVTAQVGSIGYFMYEPLIDSLATEHRNVVFGVYAISILAGVVITVALEQRPKLLGLTWIGLTALQLVWIIGYSQSSFAEQMTLPMYLSIAVGTIVPTLLCLIAVRFLACREEHSQQRYTYLLLIAFTWIGLASLWYFKSFERMQIVVVAATIIVAAILEFVSARHRAPNRQSGGVWFWMPASILLVLLSVQLVHVIMADNDDVAIASRSFYGVLKVRYIEIADEEYDEYDEYHEFGGKYTLAHGQIVHGFQFTDDYWKKQPTSYYGRGTGIGMAIRLSTAVADSTDKHALRVGIVGLGTGTLAAYGRAGDEFRFYEINPDVLGLSSQCFTYLNDSLANKKVVLGDARITMERELEAAESQQFDVLAIDAFSSDAIPVHLLTTECGEIYRKQLRPGGILALHVSNRFLDLRPVARGLANSLGWHAFQIDTPEDDAAGVYKANWILLTDSQTMIENTELNQAHSPWKDDNTISWTDDYSGLWRVLSF